MLTREQAIEFINEVYLNIDTFRKENYEDTAEMCILSTLEYFIKLYEQGNDVNYNYSRVANEALKASLELDESDYDWEYNRKILRHLNIPEF